MIRTSEELADLFKGTKETFDNAFDATRKKHGEENALAAMEFFLKKDVVAYFTNDEDARSNMQELLERPNEICQILFDYAMSSFVLNDMDNIRYAELINYAMDSNEKLNYGGKKVIQVVALAAAFNPYWTVNLLACNKRLKESLVDSFIKERYAEDKREELDNANNPRLVRFTDSDEIVFINKSKLNLAIEKMNEADDLGEYIPPTRKNGTSKK